jgi:hypothetical protein
MTGRTTSGTDPDKSNQSLICDLFGFNSVTRSEQRRWHRDLNSARNLLSEGDYSGSIQLARKCLLKAPELFDHPNKLQALCYLQIGLAEIKGGLLETATYSLRSGLKACGNSEEALLLKIDIQANLAGLLASRGEPRESLAVYILSLRSIDKLVSLDPGVVSQIIPLKGHLLEEASALCLILGKYQKAEGYLYSLAPLRAPGVARGKTLLLLGEVYRRNSSISSAIEILKASQKELLNGGAKHSEPLILANALMLEARLHFERSDLVAAHENYSAAFTLLKSTMGEYHERTLLCACDVAVVEIRFKRWMKAAKELDSTLDKLSQLRKKNSNDPAIQPYLEAHAKVEHLIGNAFSLGLKLIGELPDESINLLEVNRCLELNDLKLVWQRVFQRFPQELSKPTLIDFLTNQKDKHLNLSLTRYTQLVSSLQHQHGKSYIGLARIYDLMSQACKSLDQHAYARRLEAQAAGIRDKNKGQNGSD